MRSMLIWSNFRPYARHFALIVEFHNCILSITFMSLGLRLCFFISLRFFFYSDIFLREKLKGLQTGHKKITIGNKHLKFTGKQKWPCENYSLLVFHLKMHVLIIHQGSSNIYYKRVIIRSTYNAKQGKT